MKNKILVVPPFLDHSVFEEDEDTGVDILKRELPFEAVIEAYGVGTLSPDRAEGVAAVIADGSKVDEEFFKAAKGIIYARWGTGTDGYTKEMVLRNNILATKVLGASADAVAEYSIWAILDLLKEATYNNNLAHQGQARRVVARQIKGKTVGIYGFGLIGQGVARKLKGLEVHILAYDMEDKSQIADEIDVELVAAPEELLTRSDIVSLHVSASGPIIDKAAIEKMKDGAILVNPSRDFLIDETAVYEALECGKLSGVYHEELPKEERLRGHPHALFSHHNAGISVEACRALTTTTAQQLADFLNGYEPENIVYREVLKNMNLKPKRR